MPLAVSAALVNFAEESVMKGAGVRVVGKGGRGGAHRWRVQRTLSGMLKQSNRIYRADTMFTRVLEEASFT